MMNQWLSVNFRRQPIPSSGLLVMLGGRRCRRSTRGRASANLMMSVIISIGRRQGSKLIKSVYLVLIISNILIQFTSCHFDIVDEN